MRATRLLHLLLLLQTSGPINAPALSRELRVSPRTVYRDIDALSAAGIPVYVADGPRGGYALLDGWQTRLTGLTGQEADVLTLIGLPGQAAELGLGAALAATELKLLAALPEEAADRAGRIRQRFHLDAVAWFREPEPASHLRVIAAAVWQCTPVTIRYRRWAPAPPREVERTLQPLGLVCKAGTWYLVARPDGGDDGGAGEDEGDAGGGPRTYRVGRIQRATLAPGTFDWPEDFDLAAYWARATARYQQGLRRSDMTLRISPEGRERLTDLMGPGFPVRVISPPDGQGWVRITVPTESLDDAVERALQIGAAAEVLAPPAVRRRVIDTLALMTARYREGVEGSGPVPDAGALSPAGSPDAG
jgi:predicted DNA-binding transcriptional regulator YafY